MKHCLPDPEAEEKMSGYFTVFSCEFDNGKRARGNEQIIRLGEDGRIMLFLCRSCLDQLVGQALQPIVVEALKGKFGELYPALTEGFDELATAIKKIREGDPSKSPDAGN